MCPIDGSVSRHPPGAETDITDFSGRAWRIRVGSTFSEETESVPGCGALVPRQKPACGSSKKARVGASCAAGFWRDVEVADLLSASWTQLLRSDVRGGMSVADDLDQKSGELSKQSRRKVVRIADAIEARRDRAQLKVFSPRNFVLFGLPYRQPKGSLYERKNGTRCFRVVADPKFGLPYGQDRLIAIWLATAFKVMGCPEHNCIQFRSLTDIVRAFEIPGQESIGGKNRRRLRGQLERVFGATYFAWDESKSGRFAVAQSYRLIASMDLHFERGGNPNQYTLWQNVIELEAKFANDVRSGVVPIDLNTVRALKSNAAALDLYCWMAMRSWRCQKSGEAEVRVPLFGESGLVAQLGSQMSAPKLIRKALRCQLDLVRTVWRECPNELDGDVFVVRSANPVGPATTVLPGVTRNPPPLLPLPEDLNQDARRKRYKHLRPVE